MRGIIWFAVLLTAGLLINCSKPEKPEPPEDVSDQYFHLDGDLAASHILIAYKGAERAAESVTRTREEASALAAKLCAELQEAPDKLENLAKEFSDGTTAAEGGRLPAWYKRQFIDSFDDAVDALQINQITATPLETPFGFHIIRRDPIKVLHYAAEGFFISFKGHADNPARIRRTKEEARKLAQELAPKVNSKTFDELAAEHNDLGEFPVFLGVAIEGTSLPDNSLDTIKGLGYGQVAGPFEFPQGFVFLRRLKVERRAGSGILIAWDGADLAGPDVLRSKDEARTLAQDLIAQIQKAPDQFEDLARKHSNEPTAIDGGHMGVWFRGEMMRPFGLALEQLEIGAMTSEPVETKFGYYIIKRNPVP